MHFTAPNYLYKRQPMPHQHECFIKSRESEIFAILFEQGTGKSKVIVDSAAYLHAQGRIDTLVIVAPNGVHRKWIEEDFVTDWPDWAQYRYAIYESGNSKSVKTCENLFKPGPELRVLCINVEALSHKSGFDFLKRFLLSTEAMMAVDESSRIKNPDAKRTENLCKLGELAKYRRVLTGTPVSNSPFDYYAQFMFLDRDIFGCSYYAFKAEYSELVDKNSPLMRAIMQKSGARFAPQIVAKSPDGKPKYRNLDKLKQIISPYSMRVEKEEVMPWLPPKVYQKRYFKMEKTQQRMYDELRDQLRTEINDQSVSVLHRMTLLLRLQQVACGYVPSDEGSMIRLFKDPKDNPRIKEMLETIEDLDGPIIIWARFQEDVKQIKEVLGSEATTLYGPDTAQQREESKRAFKAGEKRFLVGTEAVGGIGLNLTVSAVEIFYNNTFSYEDRKQAEDRIHRGGQEKDSCIYADLIAEDTVDEITLKALLRKQDMATYMTNFTI